MRRYPSMAIMVLLAMVFLLGTMAPAMAKTINIHIASWNVPKDPNTKVLKLIAADLDKATNGQIKSQISFKSLGKPKDYFDAVASGVCDIAYIGIPYTPGRFPISEMFGLPINFPNNVITATAYYRMWQKGYMDKEFAEVQPICVGSTSPYNFFWGDSPVDSLAGFKGKKIRCPGGPWTELTRVLGGVPVSVSAAESYMALQRKTIDGILQVWPAVPVFKLHEVSRYLTKLDLCGFTFLVAMNKGTYAKLPAAAKEVLKNNAEKYSIMMGKAHHGFNSLGQKIYAKAGGKIVTLPPAQVTEMKKKFKPLFTKWVAKMEKRGVPAKKALADLYAILQQLGVKDPFIY